MSSPTIGVFGGSGLYRLLDEIELMEGGGEYGELTIELAASLAAHHVPVTAPERDELLGLLEAMGMPTDPIGRLNVEG